MNIQPSLIEQAGPGIELVEQVAGISLEMSDPVEDLEYALNKVTMTYDLSGVEHARLAFKALEFGDEPHAPPAAPFGDDANFDGVAVSADGVAWYEVQDLRHLRSDKFLAYDLDLDAAVAGLGIAYNAAFKIRFCQYDDCPAPMDGISMAAIRVTGDLRPAILYLTMDDDASSPTIEDAAAGGQDQTFSDASGDPNTSAHSVEGAQGTGLSFDGVDDHVSLTSSSHAAALGAGTDFSIALWWKTNAPNPASTLHFLSNDAAGENGIVFSTNGGAVRAGVRFRVGETRTVEAAWTNGADGEWHLYVLTRKGTTLSIWRDRGIALTDDTPGNAAALAPAGVDLTIGSDATGANGSPGAADEFRLYDRALTAAEIVALTGSMNRAPYPPALVSPVNAAPNVALPVTLTAGAYADMDGDAQASGIWQVGNDSGFASIAYDSGATLGPQTALAVPAGAGLLQYKRYWWRAKYKDSLGAWGDWSGAWYFDTGNRPPDGPALISPPNDATGVGQTPTLEAGAFSDPDGDLHVSGHWLIATDSGFTNIVYSSGGTNTNQTSFTVPAGNLSAATAYYWRVQYKDDRGAWGLWSPAWRFTT